VSSIEAFRRPAYRYVPSVAIVGDGEVRSVLLVARRPLAEVRSVALDPASRTGAALALVCLETFAGRAPATVDVGQGDDPRDAGADAYVRIGDAALREWSAGAPGVHDLATLWRRITGLPFVFALWLVRPGAVVAGEHATALVAARDRGVARRAELAREAARRLGIREEIVRSYLVDACRYALDERALAGLAEFHRRAGALGLADPSLRPAPLAIDESRL